MGRALAAALIGRQVCSGEEILVIDPDEGCRARCAELGCHVSETLEPELGQAAVVVLAVKPQTAPEIYGALRPLLQPSQVVMSIMAGITLAALRDGLGHEALVRVMPNTPAQIGMGMNVYHAVPTVSRAQLEPVEAVLMASGQALQVDSEDAIDAATAVSGTGPAYVFFLAEHWMQAARDLGFSAGQAAVLVQQTLLGATELWKASGKAPSTLREQVTSKGGTTAAAMAYFAEQALGQHFQDGVREAFRRAKELGR